jgi:Uma2 family endonuclease
METETTKKLFTVDEYYRMADAGILAPHDRVELIDGEIVEMSPIGHRHITCVMKATRLFTKTFGDSVVASIQNPIQLNNYTEPEPDVVLLKPRADCYEAKKLAPEDVLLIVEIAETSLRFDRKVKLPRYAAAGIPEFWIENLEDNVLLVYRNPVGNAYTTALTLHRGETISLAAFPDIVFKVEDFLG